MEVAALLCFSIHHSAEGKAGGKFPGIVDQASPQVPQTQDSMLFEARSSVLTEVRRVVKACGIGLVGCQLKVTPKEDLLLIQ